VAELHKRQSMRKLLTREQKDQKNAYMRAWKRRHYARVWAQEKARREENPEKYRAAARQYELRCYERILRSRRAHNLKKIGFTPELFAEMFETQKGCCLICSNALTLTVKPRATHACADHNHRTGKARAILCHRCNVVLGLVDEDVGRLRAMILFLESFN